MLSSGSGFQEGVELLIEFKANIDATDEYKKTSLHLAIDGGFPEIALWLIKHGASLTKEDCAGRTALHHAAGHGQLDVTKEIIRVHYERHSAFSSWLSMLNIFKHIRNLKNVLHPWKAIEGAKNKACHEYINQKDKLGKNAFVYSLQLDGEGSNEVQLHLMLNGAVTDEKLSLIEGAALMGLQMYLGSKIVELGVSAAFAGLKFTVDKLFPRPKLPPLPPPPWEGEGAMWLNTLTKSTNKSKNMLRICGAPAYEGDIPMTREQIMRSFGHRTGGLKNAVE